MEQVKMSQNDQLSRKDGPVKGLIQDKLLPYQSMSQDYTCKSLFLKHSRLPYRLVFKGSGVIVRILMCVFFL